MQTVRLEYGDGHLDASLPDSTLIVKPDPAHEPPPLPDPVEATRDAIRAPLDMAPIPELVGPGSKVTIAFPDRVKGGAHATSHRRVTIGILLDELDSAGVAREDIRLICAIGLHRMNRLAEFREYLGPEIVDRVGPKQIVNHDADDPDGIVTLPVSDHGDVVEMNRQVVESDLSIVIGHARGNPYGGYSGGYKMPATGLTTWRSIRCHHTPATFYRHDMSDASTTTHFRGQLAAIGRRMESGMKRPFFAVDAVLDHRSEQIAVAAGSIPAVERATWPIAEKRTVLQVPGGLRDVLIVGMPRNFHYGNGMGSNPILMMQSIAASLVRAQRALRPFPVIIAASICDGWFNETEFGSYVPVYRVLENLRSPAELRAHEAALATDPEFSYRYRFGHTYHPYHGISCAYQGGYALEYASAVYIAGAKEPRYARLMGAIPVDTVEDALAQATRYVGDGPGVLVVPELSAVAYHVCAEH